MTAAKPEQDFMRLRALIAGTIDEELGTGNTPKWMLDDIMRLVQAEVAAVLNHLASPSSLEDSKSYGEWVTFEIQAMLAELHPPQQPPTEGGSNGDKQ